MSVQGEIVYQLRSHGDVTTLVCEENIRQEHNTQGATFPFVTVTTPSSDHGHDLSGSAGYAETLVDVNIWARNVTERDEIADAVRGALQGYSGTIKAVIVRGITLQLDNAFFEPDRAGSETGIFHRIMTFFVSHVESIPTFA